ncbi:MAG: YkgJ family cysteine cluster protein [Gammaproteobacteria bacterium]|nr:YkgJ family cysteine cluster protein [Gammaproteobacteria bacterium]MBU1722838.1 YkgJ family cysteine cluster protein [Gammaproteobacteria bacterium]MBU2005966.1 YkgJ family cysteine cluster protein [Gammaproteobacteria bacterium]
MKLKKKAAYGKPQRLKFPAEEVANNWLGYAFDAYYRADAGVAKAIQQEERNGRKLACAKGCSSCCKSHTTIPIFPLELLGLYWYVSKIMPAATRNRLKPQLENHAAGGACPFLLDGACSVHPMRPLACRHFNVFDQVCAEGEDAFHTRREDVLTPLKSHQDAAYEAMLPFHGFTTAEQQQAAMQHNYIQHQARVLQEIDWAHLAARISG